MKNKFKNIVWLPVFALLAFTAQSCDDFEQFEPLEENSIADATPPQAAFSYSQGAAEDWLVYSFANLSTSAISYSWDFGDGGTFIFPGDPENVYEAEGMYTVTLIATDGNGLSSTYTEMIEIIEPEEPEALLPEILAPGFDLGNTDATKDPWRNSNLGGVIQVSSSSSFDGGGASKYPTDGSRIAYQELIVTPNTDYRVTYKYSQEVNSNNATVTVSILGGSVNDPMDIADATIESFEGSNATGKSDFTTKNLIFNTGANTTIAIFVNNSGGTVSYVDTFSIELN
ncbi:PKD domain-containing protein [Flavobacteriaceae bacterium]|nr:PKD domain-containing protein [Flavobacteriaceae bacterium]